MGRRGTFFDIGAKNTFNALECMVFPSRSRITKTISRLDLDKFATNIEKKRYLAQFAYPNASVYEGFNGDIIIEYPDDYAKEVNPFTKPWPELGKHRCRDGVYK